MRMVVRNIECVLYAEVTFPPYMLNAIIVTQLRQKVRTSKQL